MDAWQRNGWLDHGTLSIQGPERPSRGAFSDRIGRVSIPTGTCMTVWPGILLLVSSLSAARCSVVLAFKSSNFKALRWFDETRLGIIDLPG